MVGADPLDTPMLCLPLHVLQGVYAQHLNLATLATPRAFTRFGVSPAALGRIEDAAAAAGLDYRPTMPGSFSMRACTFRVLRSPSLLVNDAELIANETPVAAPSIQLHFALSGTRFALGDTDTALNVSNSPTQKAVSLGSARPHSCVGRATPRWCANR